MDQQPGTSSSFGPPGSYASLLNYISQLQCFIDTLKNAITQKDETISELRCQLDKYKSVLSIHSATLAQPRKTRLVGISAEAHSSQTLSDIMQVPPKVYQKTLQTRNLLKLAIYANDFLKNLGPSQIDEITLSMYPIQINKNVIIVREGDVGSTVYVLEEGKLEVTKERQHLSFLTKPGSVFGELAILYNCTRTATITTIEDCKLWAISRNCFQAIMMKSGLIKQRDYIEFLKTVPTFANVPMDVLSKIADALEEATYKRGDYIVRQGARGDTFFIISEGKVKLTKAAFTDQGIFYEQTIKTLARGDFFGEQALLNEDTRTANIIADDDKVVCLVIDRDCFQQFISKIVEDQHYRGGQSSFISTEPQIDSKFKDVCLKDITVVSTLGVGGYGRVDLVIIGGNKDQSFAMKKINKYQIVQTKQEQHIINEKRIMFETDCPFIVKLHRTFKDEKYLYMLMEPCLGGELWTVLRDRRCFDDESAKFYTGCVIEAFSYLHSRHIIYRDLKPENMLLDEFGYVKLTDFGFAKRLYPPGSKTWTFCGTPDYVSPEIIMNKGHDFSCDYWSLGILMFELLTGAPPFSSEDSMTTYNIILRGIDSIDFPRTICQKAQNLIKRLCRENSTERLGYQKGGFEDIMKHKWFDGFNWFGLRERSLTAPYVPKIKNATDTSNFDVYPPDTSEVPVDSSKNNWDRDF